MTNGTQPTFEIGLAMAGAISAGAYAAGVMDFLIEALDEWEKQRGKPEIPNHRVVIKVVSGASAGAITGALGVVALAGGLRPQVFTTPGPVKINCVLPALYETWVVKPRLVAASGKLDLLSLQDLDAPQGGVANVPSVLNSTLLDDIREAAFKLPGQGKPLAYIASNLHIYLTVTNLRGIPYAESFAGGAYGMQCHGDRMHYVVQGLGGTHLKSEWADGDAGQNLDVKSLFPKPTDEWVEYGRAAVASGAFPVGLAPRLLKTSTAAYRGRYLPIDLPTRTVADPSGMSKTELMRKDPNWPSPWYDSKEPNRAFEFLTVDGGVINNEPFEYARFTLMDKPPRSNERNGKTADRAVVMIDPFPEPPDFLADGKPAADIIGVVSALFPALINQARFKPSELLDAADEQVFSRFMIAPKRNIKDDDHKSRSALYTIACGLLGGFGGFLDEEFRRHDFQLGRRNCQRFLKQAFALPADNVPIIQTWTVEARNNPQCRTEPDNGGPVDYRIIPIVGSANAKIDGLSWPRMSKKDFETLQARLAQRLAAITPILIERQTKGRILRVFLKVAALVGKGRILTYASNAILADLIRRDQIQGWTLPATLDSDQTRAVLAELASPAFDLRTLNGLVRATKLPVKEVTTILNGLLQVGDKPYRVWTTVRKGKQVYTLESRKPSGVHDIPIIGGVVGGVVDWFDAPVIDED